MPWTRFFLPTDPVLSDLKGESFPESDTKVEASDRQIDLLIQACEYRSEGWWMRLKIYGFRGDMVSVDLRVLLVESEKVVEFMTPTSKVPTVDAN
jgi:hypothetical protein